MSCGAVTDIKHGFKETTNETCPKCGGELKRLFNPAGIVFKGSGFYVTDSRKSEGASKGESSKGESSKSESPKSEGSKSGSGGTGDAAA